MGAKIPKYEERIEVSEEIKIDHFVVKNWVANEWDPIISGTGVRLYNIFMQAANKKQSPDGYGGWFFSLQTLEGYMMLSHHSIVRYTELLQICGLIRKEPPLYGQNSTHYTVLEPPFVSQTRLEAIIEICETEHPEWGENSGWRKFFHSVAERCRTWQPLDAFSKAKKNQPMDMLCPNCRAMQTIPAWKIRRDWEIDCPCGMRHAVSKWQPAQMPLSQNGTSGQVKPLETVLDSELVAALVTRFSKCDPTLSAGQAQGMIETYGAEKVKQQLEWLDKRYHAENPLKTLRASLKYGWSEPVVNEPVREEVAESDLYDPDEVLAAMERMKKFKS